MTDASNLEAAEVVLDVREDLNNGREPFSRIMAAAEQVPAGGSLILYATFKPVPLIAVLSRQGFESEASPLDGGDWKVIFKRSGENGGSVSDPGGSGGESSSQAAAGAQQTPSGASNGGIDIELDNRGLEPPMPMVRTLEAVNQLQPGGKIVGLYDRRPMFLIPKLDQMGYTHEITELKDGGVQLVIRRGS